MDRRGIIHGRHRLEKRNVSRQLRREMTAAETALWERVRAGGLQGLHFRRQQVIDGFVADFYCHRAGLVVELDGSIHQETGDYDADRDAILARRGLRVLRVRNEQVLQDIGAVLVMIWQHATRSPS